MPQLLAVKRQRPFQRRPQIRPGAPAEFFPDQPVIRGVREGPGISVKLSALCPRSEATHEDRVWEELYPRTLRLAKVVETLSLLHHHKIAQALESVRAMIKDIRQPDFDFEAASNLVALLSQLAKRAIQLEEVYPVIDQLGLRFCSSRAMSELLAGAGKAHPEYADHIRTCSAKVLKYAEYAMSLSLKGDPAGAVKELVQRGEETLNTKLVDSALSVLERYHAKIGDTTALQAQVQDLRGRCASSKARVALGEGQRKAGALTLRIGGAKKDAPAG